jgi:hypothetical protein
MQTLVAPDAQTTCDELLNLDGKIMYSGFLDESGSMVGEATKDSISSYDRLTVMVLPINSSKSSLVLAAVSGSDLTNIVERAKKLLDLGYPVTIPFTS